MVNRDLFYATIPDFWDRLYGTEYALYDCITIDQHTVEEVKQATNVAYHVFNKMNDLLREAADETLLELGFPSKGLPFLRMNSIPYETVIGRFDFVQTTDGLKLLEFNSDTPTFIRELFEVNGLLAKQFQLENPNSDEELVLGKAIRNSVFHCAKRIGVSGHPYVVFTAHEEDIEDRETMKYLMRAASIKGAAFVPLEHIQILAGEGVYDPAGNKIDVLYRHTYPLEALLEDVSSDQFPIGIECMNLVLAGKVGMLNPTSAFLMQSKAVMAAIWGMHEHHHPLFTEEEHAWIEQIFLPTYLDEEPFSLSGDQYVKKPAFGREGDTVEVRKNGEILFSPKENSYQQYVPIYQKYVDLPVQTIQTEKGPAKAHLLIGSFVINGKASAFGFRAGAQITDNLSYFLPCGVKGATKWM
ncbi:glutathionylspermidine synthase family protein [Halalkalibacter akibai]|uniref:Glutathionylspermidine synthase n=1 Tax=Halalkalibacter akibai (strain ATCC 43226 / DSM 21942 / CIP 109018 / JCM 9157 / 1139) TaxID=1236973 RepID=W4QNM8_HALA3|nr:glutathionylspermidine synthase family protein [Halalkalibacter akibai]GAE33691.1 glutathionylspermidine synthase [Halalkalibacter akibai JCM 9157]